MVVVMLGFGIVIPIIPYYIESFGAGGNALGLLMAVFAVMQFIFSPIWGTFSDRFGRKNILIIGCLGNALAHVLFGLSTELWMLFVSRILGGILSSATIPAAMAYIGDSTTAKERGWGMGIIGAAMGLGMVLGPGLGGWFAKGSLSMPFYIAAALSVLSMALIVVGLPESLPQEQRSRISITGQIFQFGSMWELLFGPFGFLLVLAFLVSFGLTNFEAVFGLFAIKRYGYGPERVGSVLAIIGLISAVMQGTLSGPLSRRWGEARIIEISLIASAVGFVLMLQAETFRAVLATVSFFMISNALLRPAVSSLLSQQAGHSQGKIMGISNAYMSLGRIAGPACAGFLFEINISYPYLSGASIMFIGFLACLRFLRRKHPPA